MSNSDSTRKRQKQKTATTTNPGTSRPGNETVDVKKLPEHQYPLLAKYSEWVDNTLQPTRESSAKSARLSSLSDEEEVLQLISKAFLSNLQAKCPVNTNLLEVDCEDGNHMKPLAIMFPDLIEKKPEILEGVVTRAMSTTEVTRHLVDLGQKANFTLMKKTDRLIPLDKQWMETLTEDINSRSSINSTTVSNCILCDIEVDGAISTVQTNIVKKKKKRPGNTNRIQKGSCSRDSN